jgi:3,4-dihydroxy 2-butanone 4-phosphate synthase / GTP cyclohydrolase II
MVKGDPATFAEQSVMVRVHSECLTGDAFGSLRCDCRMQLQAALKMIDAAGRGVVVYLRQEGRGIGLVNKLKAYSLQDMGLDTVEANEKLGLPVDQRNYGIGAQILNDIGVQKFCLITNNPRKIAGIKGYGLDMVSRVPLIIEATAHNSGYLATKAQKLGHLLVQTYLATVAIHWRSSNLTVKDRYQKLEQLRGLAQSLGLMLQEEARPVAAALFSQPDVIVNLGLEGVSEAGAETWYQDCNEPKMKAIATLLDKLATWSDIDQLAFLISDGSDPFSGLQVKLDRQVFQRDGVPTAETVKPSDLCESLESQRIYVFSSHLPAD